MLPFFSRTTVNYELCDFSSADITTVAELHQNLINRFWHSTLEL